MYLWIERLHIENSYSQEIAGEDFTVVSSSDKEIFKEIDKARKNELASKRGRW